MEKNDLKELIKDISAIIPLYLEGIGNASKICLKNKEERLDKRDSKKIVAELAALMAVDLMGLKKFVKLNLQIRNNIPLPLNPELLLVPIRVRKPLISRDSATGYFNYFSIKDVVERGRFAHIVLENGEEIATIQRERTIRNTILFSQLVYSKWRQVYVNPYVKGVGKELYNSAKLEMIRNIMEDELDY